MEEFIYVKPVPGRLVPRYPTLSSSTTTFIGARRHGKKLEWTPDAVVRIPRAEWVRYLKEYNRALADGSLKKVTSADFNAWEKSRAEKERAAAQPAPEAAGDKTKGKTKKTPSVADEGEQA